MADTRESGEQYIYRICTMLTSSASGLFEEPDFYGPLRLLLIFPMVASLPDYVPGLKPDSFLLEINKEIIKAMNNMASAKPDEQKELLKKVITEINVKLAQELIRRQKKNS